MKRRTFLKSMFGTGLAAGSFGFSGAFGLATARAQHVTSATAPTLVVIFQRGGCDGLNTVVPYGDTNYYNLRPTIGIAAPNASNANAALAINDAARGHANFFGLNPNMASMLPIYDAGHMAVLPAVHYPNNSHSHFSGQDFIESAVPNTTADGWLYRDLFARSSLGGLQGLSFGNELAKSLRGDVAVTSLKFLQDFEFPRAAGDIVTRLTNNVLPLYNATPSPATDTEQLVHQTGQTLFTHLDTLANMDTVNYQPENNASYPNTDYGRRLQETAQLIKADLGVEVVTVNIGGFDTHANQGGAESVGTHSIRLKEFADGISALYTDLGTVRMDNVIILTVTEFGRTAKVNGSNGTDHGNASTWFVVGKNIQGGIHGAWPGLAESQLDDGRYLRYTIDYRDVFGDILLGHMGHSSSNLSYLLPQHSYTAVGLFG